MRNLPSSLSLCQGNDDSLEPEFRLSCEWDGRNCIPSGVIRFGRTASGEDAGPTQREKNGAECPVDDLLRQGVSSHRGILELVSNR